MIKASTVVMSHLSDTQEMIEVGMKLNAVKRINFAKYIILQCKGDLTQEIDPDKMYKEFNDKT